MPLVSTISLECVIILVAGWCGVECSECRVCVLLSYSRQRVMVVDEDAEGRVHMKVLSVVIGPVIMYSIYMLCTTTTAISFAMLTFSFWHAESRLDLITHPVMQEQALTLKSNTCRRITLPGPPPSGCANVYITEKWNDIGSDAGPAPTTLTSYDRNTSPASSSPPPPSFDDLVAENWYVNPPESRYQSSVLPVIGSACHSRSRPPKGLRSGVARDAPGMIIGQLATSRRKRMASRGSYPTGKVASSTVALFAQRQPMLDVHKVANRGTR